MNLLLALFGVALGVPPATLSWNGSLLDDQGIAVTDGSYSVSFHLYDHLSGGTEMWSEQQLVETSSGTFTATLGDDVPLDDVLADVEEVWLELVVEGEALSPRLAVTSVPWALRAAVAEDLACDGCVDGDQIDPDAVQVRITGTCAAGDVVVGVGADGSVTCETPQVDLSGLVTGVAAGEGLLASGDPTAPELSLDIDRLGDCADGFVTGVDEGSGAFTCATAVDWGDLTGIPDIDTVLSEAEVEAFITNGPVALAEGTTIGGAAPLSADSVGDCADGFVTGVDEGSGAFTCATAVDWGDLTGVPAGLADAQDDDTLAALGVSCTVGGSSPVWDALTTRWTCEVVDTVLSEAEVEAFISNDPVALAEGTTIGGAAPLSLDPSGDLVIDGAIHSTTEGIRFPDGTSQMTAAGATPGRFKPILGRKVSGSVRGDWTPVATLEPLLDGDGLLPTRISITTRCIDGDGQISTSQYCGAPQGRAVLRYTDGTSSSLTTEDAGNGGTETSWDIDVSSILTTTTLASIDLEMRGGHTSWNFSAHGTMTFSGFDTPLSDTGLKLVPYRELTGTADGAQDWTSIGTLSPLADSHGFIPTQLTLTAWCFDGYASSTSTNGCGRKFARATLHYADGTQEQLETPDTGSTGSSQTWELPPVLSMNTAMLTSIEVEVRSSGGYSGYLAAGDLVISGFEAPLAED